MIYLEVCRFRSGAVGICQRPRPPIDQTPISVLVELCAPELENHYRTAADGADALEDHRMAAAWRFLADVSGGKADAPPPREWRWIWRPTDGR